MFKKKIKKIKKIKKKFNLYNKLIRKLNFIKNIINGGSPLKDKNSINIIFLNLLNFAIYIIKYEIEF